MIFDHFYIFRKINCNISSDFKIHSWFNSSSVAVKLKNLLHNKDFFLIIEYAERDFLETFMNEYLSTNKIIFNALAILFYEWV